MKSRILGTIMAGTFLLATVFTVPATPALANDALKKLAIGLGAAVLFNQATKNQINQATKKQANGSQTSGGPGVSTSNQAAESQQYLNDLGYDAGPVDGQPGGRTRAAIGSFQRDRGFPVTGELSAPQFAALRANQKAVVNPPAPGKINRASKNEAQVYLNQLGHNAGTPDGAWGPRSQQALDSYRAANGLQKNTGTLNEDDLANLHLKIHGTSLTIATSGKVQTPQTGAGFGSVTNNDIQTTALEPDEYQHYGVRVEGSEGLTRELAVQMLKAKPDLLDKDDNLESWFRWEHPHLSPTELRSKFKNANQLEQQEIMRQFKAGLLREAVNTAAVSEDNPLKIAIYGAVKYGFGDFVDGRGLPLASGSASGTIYKNELNVPYLRQRVVVNVDTPGGDFVDVSLTDASLMLDQIKDSQKGLYRVAWGRITNIGLDELVANFAEADGVYDAVQIASTFIVDRVTLSLGGYSGPGVWEETAPEVIYSYPVNRNAEPNVKGKRVFDDLKISGLPLKNGHILTFPGPQNHQAVSAVYPERRFVDYGLVKGLLRRAWFVKNPDYVREGQNFILVANNILNEAEKRQFFGDAVKDLIYLRNGESVLNATMYSQAKFFPDEFAEADAKRAFLSDIYPRKMTEISNWDVPVMQVLGATLLPYDTESGSFQIFYDGSTTDNAGEYSPPVPVRIAGFTATAQYEKPISAYSSDLISKLPERLELPFDQARELRKSMNGSDRIYLAWTAVLNLDEDGTASELTLNPTAKTGDFNHLVRRAMIGSIVLFSDPDLTVLVKEYDAATLGILPDTAAKTGGMIAEPDVEDSTMILTGSVQVDPTVVSAKEELVVMAAAPTQQKEPVIEPVEQGIWPQIRELDSIDPIRDIVGLRIGDPVSGVDQIIAKEFDLTQIFHTEAPTGASLVAFEYIRVFLIEGGKQIISLMSYGPDGPILGISRHFYRAQEPWPDAAIAKSLVDKYGEPKSRTFEDRSMVWSNSDACADIPVTPLGARQFMSVGSGMPNGDLDHYLAAQALGGLAVLAVGSEDYVETSATCGEALIYSNQPLALVNGHYGFYTFMTDFGLVQQVLDATTPKNEELKIKF